MKSNDYKDKLLDPRWQKLRLLILERDNFKCRSCQSKDDTLHVHHINYEKGKNPWEYENDNLITLCEECHRTWHAIYNSNLTSEYVSCVVKLSDELEQMSINNFFDKKEKTVEFNF